uniref:Uncharacterized protein n=1 Tax=Ditylenchus dipsaci TaxID=166011 RepID=A0A915DJW6_9BILA
METGGEVIYDCKTTMFTSKKINLEDPQILISNEEVNDYVRQYCGDANFTISITPNAAVHELDLDDYNQYVTKKSLYNEDRSVRTFLEMAITQFSINNNQYTPVGAGNSSKQVLKTASKWTMGWFSDLVLPRCAYCARFRASKAMSCFGRQKCLEHRRSGTRLGLSPDVRVEVMFARHRSFGIGRLSEKPMSELMCMWEKKKVSMQSTSRSVMTLTSIIQIFLPSFRIILCRVEDRWNYGYLHPDNAVLRAFGITVVHDSIRSILEFVVHRYSFADNQVVEPTAGMADWRRAAGNLQYLDTNEISNWIVLCDNQQKVLVGKFISVMMMTARKKGLIFAKPPTISTLMLIAVGLKPLRDRRYSWDVEVLRSSLQGFERTCNLRTSRDVVRSGKMQTLDNILNKTNCKFLGSTIHQFLRMLPHPPPVSTQERRLLQAKGMNSRFVRPIDCWDLR